MGYTQILGQLRRRGIHKITCQTVKNILKEHGLDPGKERGKGAWDEFLRSHTLTHRECDFAAKRMWTFRGIVDVNFLGFLHLGTRRSWISPSTVHPDSAWSCQQARNFLMHAEKVQLPPKCVLPDNDPKYTSQYDTECKSSDADIVMNTPQSPNLGAHVSHSFKPCRLQCLDKLVVASHGHLNLINREFQRWYNHERMQTAGNFLPPGCESPPESRDTIKLSDVMCETRLDGVLRSYSHRAAELCRATPRAATY